MKRKAAKQWIRYRLARGKKWQRMIGWRTSIQLTFSAPVLALSVGVAGTLLSQQAQGATYDWTGVAGTAWDTTGDAWTAGPSTTPWDAINGPANVANFTASASPALTGNVFTNGVILQSGVSVALGGTGTLNFVGASPTLTLGNSVNTSLWFTSSNVLAGSPVVTVAGTPSGTFARFMLEGTTQAVGGLSDTSGSLVIQNAEAAFDGGLNNTGTGTLILNGAGNYSTNGFVRDATGKLAIVMNGTGTQTFVGGNINYTGTTTINSGTLVLQDTTGFNSAVTVNAGGVLTTTGSGTASIGTSGSLTLNGGTYNQNATNWRVWSAPNPLTVTALGGTINASNALLFDGGLTGSGNLVINNTGAGSVGFRGANISGYSGDLTVNGGTIGASVNGLFSNSNVTLGAGSTFNTNGVSFTGASDQSFKSLNGGGTLTGTGQTVTLGSNNGSGSFSGVIGGSVAIVKTGTGTQTFSGTNTTTGGTTVNGGVLNLDYTTNNTTKLANGAALVLGGGTVQLTGGSHVEVVASTTLNAGSSQIVRTSGTGVLQMGTITRNTGATIDFSADNIATTTTGLDASGILGTWATVGGTRYATKSGNNIIAYTGTAAASVNNFVSSTVNYEYSLSGGTDTLTASRVANTVRYSGTGETIDLGAAGANTLTFGSIMNAGTGTLVIQRTGGTGSVILAAGGDNIITRAGGDITISAPISSGSLSKTGAGTLTLAGNNTYVGTTTINGGTLKAGSATALGASTNALIVSQGTTLDLNGNTVAVGSLADNTGGLFGGTITNTNAAAAVLTVGSANTSTSFGGVLQNGVGTLGLNKIGTGTLTLTSDSALGGPVTVNGGTLALGNGGTTGSLGGASSLFGAGGVTVTSPGTLAVNRSGTATVASTISGTGAVTYAGGGTFTYGGTASNAGHTGTTTITQGSVVLSKTGGAVAIGGDLILNSSAANSANVWATQNNQTSGTGLLNLANATNQARFMLEGTTQSFAGITNAAAGVGVIQNAETAFDGGLANTGTGTLNLNVTGGPFTFSGFLRDGGSGKLALNKTGAGTQTLSGGNINYTGATTVGGGVLNLVNTTGMASATTVNTGGILRTTNTANTSYGAGFAITLNGGTFEHNQNFFSTFGGPLTVASASTIKALNTTGTTQAYFDAGAGGSGNLTVDNTGGGAGAGIVFRNAGAGTSLTGVVTVNNGLIGYGNGATALRDAQLTLNGAKLVMDGSNSLAINAANNGTVGALVGNNTSSVLLGTGGTLTMGGRNQNDLFAGVISGGGGITKTGTGTQTLSGNNTYSGATAVNAGALLLTGNNTLAGGLTVNNGGTLSVSGTSTLNGLTSVNRGGTLTLSGAIGGTGATTVSGGTLNLDYSTQDNSKLANGVPLTLGGATVNLIGGTHTEVVGSTIFAAGDTQINRTSGTAQLNLGAITVQTGATADFSTAGFAITSTSNDVSGILGANITVNNGQDYAVNNGDLGGGVGHIVAATSISVGRLGPGNIILSNSTANYKIIEAGVTGNITLGGVGVTQVNTINNASTGGMAVINTTGNSLVLGVAGGILGGTSSAGLTIGTAADAGSLSAGGTTANAAGSITVANNSAVGMVINSTIINHGTGAVSLTKTGAGTLTLNGTNTYTGATGINAGTLIAGNNSALGVNSNLSVASGATLDINGKTLAAGSLNNVNSQGGTVTNNGAAGTLSVGGVNSSGTFSGVIQDGSGALALTKIGTGTQTLLGTNTYSGLTTISAGTLQIGNGGNAGTLGSGNVVNNSSLVFNRNDVYTVANAISGTGTTSVINGGTVTFTGAIASTQALTSIATNFNSGARIILNRVGGNTVGNVDVGVEAGTGNYALGGILQLGASDQIADTSTVMLRSQANNSRAGQFLLSGFNETIGGLNSSGNGSGIRVWNTAATDSTLTITGSGSFGSGGGVITDGGTGKLNIVKTGAGTQAFQGGSYNYTGTTTVTGGTLSIRSTSFNTSATTVAGGTLDFQGPATVNTTIAGTSGLVTISAGTVNFGGGAGTKTYSTLTQISGGATLSQSAANSFSTLSRHDVAAGSILTTNGNNGAIGSLTGAGQVKLEGSTAVLSIGGDNTTDAIFSGQIGGASASDIAGGIRKYGTGTQTLTGNINNYAGTTTVADGILRIGNGGTTGVLGTGAVSLLSPGTLEFKRSDAQTIANQISGNGNVSHTGTGTTTLTGANTYSGTTTVSTGTLKAGVATLGGASPSSGAFGVNSAVTVASGATLDLNGFDESLGSLSGAGTVTSSNAASRTLTVGTGGLSGAFSGIISNGVGGTTGLLKTGAGTQTLTGANTYTGTTTVGGGTLALDFSGAAAPLTNIVSSSSSLTMSGGTLVITGKAGATNTQTFAGTTVTGGSTIQLVQNGATSLDVSLGALNFSGGGLTFMGGTGTTTGARFITTSSAGANDGTTRLGGGSLWSNGNFASIMTVAGVNYVVEWNGVITNIYTGSVGPTNFSAAATVIPNAGAASVSIITGGGAGTNTLQAATTTVDSLSMKATDAPSLIDMGSNTLVVGSGANATGDLLISNGVGVKGMTVGLSANQGFVTAGSSGASNLNVSNNSATELLTVNSAVVNNAGGGVVTVNISGGGSNGKVVFAGTNTYTGNTSIGGGTLQIAGAGSLGSGSYAGAIAITGGTLQYSSSANQTLSGLISGTGGLVKDTDATSTLTLTANNTYGGGTIISAGHLQVGNGGGTGMLGSGSVTNNADLIFNRDNSSVYTVANLITGTGTVVKKGNGTVVYTADNSYAGLTTIENGTLQLGNGGTTGSFGTGNVALTSATSTLAINHSNAVILGNVISGPGNLTQMGTGTTTVNGNNTYTGVTTVSGGVLQVSTLANGGVSSSIGAASAAASNLVLSGGGTLAYVGTATALTDRGFTLAGNATVSNLSTAEFLTMSGSGVHTAATNDTLTLHSVSSALSTLSGALTQPAGTLNVNKTGSGIWALTSGASNYTGTTTVTEGTLQVQVLANGGANSSIGASSNAASNLVLNAGTILSYVGGTTATDHNFTLNGSATLAQDGAIGSTLTWNGAPVVTSAGTTTLTLGGGADINTRTGIMAGVLANGAGTLELTKSGTSTWVLTNANTYSGVTRVTAGTLQIGNGGNTGTLGTNTSVVLSGGGNLAFNRNDAISIAKVISGSGTVSQIGTGTTTLTGNGTGNTYTGATIVSNGVLKAGIANNAFGNNTAVTVGTGVTTATLDLAGFSENIGSLGGNANGVITSSVAGAVTLTTTGGGGSPVSAYTYAGVIQDGSGTVALTKTGGGTEILTGTNTYSGLTTISGGTLMLGNGGTTGSLGSGNVVNNATLAFNHSNNFSVANTISGTGIVQQIGSGTTVLSPTNTYTGKTQIFNGALSVSTINSVATNGALGTVHLANSDLGSPTTVANGTIDLGSGGATGTLIYTGAGETTDRVINLNGTTGGGTIDQSGTGLLRFTSDFTATGVGAKTLTLKGSTAGAGEIDGNIADSTGGATSLLKDGTGTWTLLSNNSYTGTTTINAGTLQLGNGGTQGSIGSSNIINNGTLAFNRSDTVTYSGSVSGTGSVVQRGSGTTILTGISTYTGKTIIENGTISVDTIQDMGALTGSSLGRPNVGDTANSYIDLGTATTTGTFKYTGDGDSTNRGFNLVGNGTLDQSGTGTLAIVDNGIQPAIASTTAGAHTLTLTGSSVGDGLISGTIADGVGTVGIAKTGTGTWTLSGANTYTGDTNVNAGVLNIQNSNALGTTAGDTSVASGAALQLQNNIAVGVGEALTLNGTGVANDGALRNISGTNSWAGPITLGSATRINSDAGLLTLSGGIGGAAQNLTVGGAGNTTVSGVIATTTGTLTKDGTGTLTLTNANTYTGATSVNAGTLAVTGSIASTVVDIATGATLSVSNGAAINDLAAVTSAGTGAFTLNNSETIGSLAGTGTVDLGANTLTTGGNNTSTTYAGVIGGTGGDLTKTGTGTFTLTGTNTYTGDTTVSDGILKIGGSGSLGSGTYAGLISLASTGTLEYNSTVAQTLSGTISGTGALTQSGPGKLTLTGNSAGYTGATTVNGGTLDVAGSIASSPVTVNNGGILTGDGTVGATTINAGGILANNVGTSLAMGATSLSSTAITSVGLGAASNPALFNVTGSLTLDGNINVTDAGGFTTSGSAPVVYHIYTYTGALTNNGLAINSLPAGADPTRLIVQTSINGQVNLVDTNGFALSYWDGDDTGLYNNNQVNGGNGTWFGASGPNSSQNWTDANGVATSIKAPNSFAFFAGTAGTVTVNDATAAGVPDAAGLYFMTTGYTLNGGSILLANGGSGAPLHADPGVTATINSKLTGTENINKTGTGTIILGGVNTYTGSTTVSAGTLSVTGSIASTTVNISDTATLTVENGAALADNAAVISAGTGAFTLNNNETIGSLAGTGTVNLGANTLTTGGTNASTSYAGVIGGTGGLTKAGTGNFTLTGVNTYTGATSIAGTLTIDGSGVLGSGNYAGAITNNGSLAYSSTANQTLGGVISGTGSLTKDEASTLTLTGANTYAGTTSVNAGVLNIQNSTALGTTAGGTTVASGAALQLQNNIAVGAESLTLNGTGVANDGALRNISGTNSWAGLITLGSATRINSDAGLLTLSGGIGGAAQNLTVGGAGDTTVSGVIATTTGTLTKDGAGTLTLTNANTYTGATTVSAGTLAVTGSVASTVVDIATGATLSVSNGAAINNLAAVTSAGTGAFILNNSETIGSLAGTGTVNLGANTLTTGGNNASTSYAGVISGTGGGLTKAGTGNFTLTGVNTYTGNTSIAGTLTLGGSGSLGSGNYAGNIANNGSLVHSSSANQVLSGVLSGAGSLIQNGAGTLTLAGNSAGSFTGATTVNGSTLIVDGSIANSAVTVNTGGILTGNGTVGATTINAGGILDAGSIGNPGILNVAGNLGIAGTYRVDISGVTAGTGYDQTKVVGTVTLGGGSTLVLNDPTFTVPGGNTLTIIDNDGADAVSGIFSGLTAGTSISAGASNFKIFYDGGDGNDVVLVSTSLPSPLYINNEWTAAATVDGDQELAGSQTAYVGINAFDSLANALATYSSVSGGAAYAGDIFVNGGTYANVNLAGGDAVTLKLVSDGGNAQPDVTIQNLAGDANDAIVTRFHGAPGNADLTVQAGSFAGVISGGGDLTKTTAGTLTLSGTNTYTGATNVNGGTLNVTGSIATSSLLTVNTGGTLTGTGTVGATNVASGGTLANNAGSTLTLGSTTLDPNSTTAVGLGTASNPALFAVNGNLTLDGKLNITNAGGFSTNGTGATIITPGLAPVIYRLYTYTGSLTNNGLDINTVPAGADPARLFVQTAVNGQVNLIDTNGAVLNYWDGDDSSKYNNASPDGGNGTWFGTSGVAGSSGNWTGANGGPTTIKSAGSFAIFAGTAGTVAVNNTNGTPDAAGLYFQTTGYTIGSAPNTGTILLANGGSGSNLDAAADVTATVNAVLSSAENISKTGNGTVILAGTNTYTGSTTVSAGTLSVTGSIASTVVNINTAATLTVANGAALADNAAVTSAGTGAFTLSNNETIGSLAGTGTVNLGANTLTTGGTNASTSYAGVIGGTGGLTKAGNGNFTLTGVNTYTGDTSIAGTLTIDGSGVLGSGNYAGAITNNGSLAYSSTANQTLGGVISGTGSLTKDEASTLTLTGANTYAGTTSVNAGVLNIQNSTALGTTAGGTSVASGAALQLQNNIAVGAEALTLNGTGVANDGALRNISGTNSWAGPITLGSATRINSDAGLMTLSGGIGGAAQSLTVGGAGNTTVSGVIATTTGTLTKDGTGTLTLTNANTYTGATTVSAGTLAVTGSVASTVVDIATGATLSVSNGAAINDLAAVTSAGTGAFTLNNNETIGSLAGTGTVNLGVNTLTTGGNDTSTSYAGVIGGTGGLTKAGTGNFTLTGANTYTGNTAINGGTLTLGGSGSLGNGNYAGNIANNGALVHSSSVNQVLSGVLSGAGSLTQNGAGTLTLTGNSAGTFTGPTTVNGSTLIVDGSIASSVVAVNAGGTLTGTGTVGATSINTGGTLDAGSVGNPGILNVAGSLGIAGTYRVDISGLAAGTGYDQTVVTGTVTLGGGSTLVLNDPTFAVPGGNGLTIIDNDGSDAVSGTFSGLAAGASINAGASNFKIFYDAGDGNDVVLVSTTMASPLYINNEWTSAATVDGDQELAGNQTSYVGVNAFDSLANALATYSAANSGADYTGDIFVNGGTYSNVNLTGGDAVTLQLVSDGGNAQPDVTIQNLSGDADDAIVTQAHGTAGNGDLIVEQGSFAGVISGGGDLTKTTAGTLTLSGTNTYTGATNVDGGTLNVTGSIATSSLLTVNTGGTLTGTGTVGVTNVASGGTLANNDGSLLTLGATTLDPNATTAVGLGATSNTKLFAVNGNLTLDGKLDITDVGGFSTNGTGATLITLGLGPVVYHLYTYTGSLTNNGLDINTLPAGTDASRLIVQTAINGQVNLINTNGAILSYWDGDNTGLYNNNEINGGNGIWTGSSPNWTDPNGIATATKAPNSYAYFAGDAGTVTVDDATAGQPEAKGMYFNTNGYLLTGGSILLANDGNGSLLDASAGVTATIDSNLTGVEDLNKTGDGTIVLGGANTYTGDTTVAAGTLDITGSIASDNVSIATGATLAVSNGTAPGAIKDTAAVNSTGGIFALNNSEVIGSLEGDGTVDLRDSSILTTGGNNASTTYAGIIGGSGGLTKEGTGTMALTSANTYDGPTAVNAGVLNIQNGSALGSTAGGTTVASGAALQLQNDITVGNEALTLNGTGVNNDGALRNLSGANSWGGSVTLGSDSRINTDAGTLTIQGAISGPHSLTLDSAGDTVLNGTINLAGGALNKEGVGTLSLNNNATLGSLNNSAGNLVIAPSGATTTGAFTQLSGATLTLDVSAPGIPLTVSNSVSLAGNLSMQNISNLSGAVNKVLISVGDAATVNGTFDVAEGTELAVQNGFRYLFSYMMGDGNDIGIKAIPLRNPELGNAVQSLMLISQASALDVMDDLEDRVALHRRIGFFEDRASSTGNVAATLASSAELPAGLAADQYDFVPDGLKHGTAYAIASYGQFNYDNGLNGNSERYKVGYDAVIRRDAWVGAEFTYSRMDWSQTTSTGDLDAYRLSLYGTWEFKPQWFLDGGMGAGLLDLSTERAGGLKGDLNGWDTYAFARLAWRAIDHQANGAITRLEPFVGLRAVHTELDGFTESGGTLPYSVSSQSSTLGQVFAGVNWSQWFDAPQVFGKDAAWGYHARLQGFLGAADQTKGANMMMIGASGASPMAVDAADDDNWGGRLTIGTDYRFGDWTISADASVSETENTDSWQTRLNVSWWW